MITGLLVLDENLASSIALRYASQLAEYMPITFKAAHVEDPNTKSQSAGTGWVQRAWEEGVEDAGRQTVRRLINTEKVNCKFLGSPKIVIGDRDDELLGALGEGSYDLFIEGNLNTSNVDDFYTLITSKLYRESTTPMLIVKNLVSPGNAVLICGDEVDPQAIVPKFLTIAKDATFTVDILFYKFQENEAPLLLDGSEGGNALAQTEALLSAGGFKVRESRVVCGTPEQSADLLRDYGMAFTSFPTRRGVRLELLAHMPTPVVLCR